MIIRAEYFGRRGEIAVYLREEDGALQVAVNWPAKGSVPVAEAEQFAGALSDALQRARELQACVELKGEI